MAGHRVTECRGSDLTPGPPGTRACEPPMCLSKSSSFPLRVLWTQERMLVGDEGREGREETERVGGEEDGKRARL